MKTYVITTEDRHGNKITRTINAPYLENAMEQLNVMDPLHPAVIYIYSE